MIAVDSNLLVYAHRRDAKWHETARERIVGLAESSLAWAIPWPCVHEFLAIVTHPRIYRPPSSLELAMAQIEAWMESPGLRLLGEGPRHWLELRSILEASQITGPRVHDARVAAICKQHGVAELWSVDRDFSRFSGLEIRNPLA